MDCSISFCAIGLPNNALFVTSGFYHSQSIYKRAGEQFLALSNVQFELTFSLYTTLYYCTLSVAKHRVQKRDLGRWNELVDLLCPLLKTNELVIFVMMVWCVCSIFLVDNVLFFTWKNLKYVDCKRGTKWLSGLLFKDIKKMIGTWIPKMEIELIIIYFRTCKGLTWKLVSVYIFHVYVSTVLVSLSNRRGRQILYIIVPVSSLFCKWDNSNHVGGRLRSY